MYCHHLISGYREIAIRFSPWHAVTQQFRRRRTRPGILNCTCISYEFNISGGQDSAKAFPRAFIHIANYDLCPDETDWRKLNASTGLTDSDI